MPTDCCGQPREGRYCSECGRRLEVPPSPLERLLDECRRAEAYHRKWRDASGAATEWQARGDALAALMEREGGAK